MSDRYSTAGKRYSTDGLIGCLQAYRGFQRDCFSKEEIDAIVARLRAADALLSAAADLENLAKQLMKETEASYNEDAELAEIRKAIAGYDLDKEIANYTQVISEE